MRLSGTFLGLAVIALGATARADVIRHPEGAVTIAANGDSSEEVLGGFARQLGLELRVAGLDLRRPITLDLREVSFETGVRALVRAAGGESYAVMYDRTTEMPIRLVVLGAQPSAAGQTVSLNGVAPPSQPAPPRQAVATSVGRTQPTRVRTSREERRERRAARRAEMGEDMVERITRMRELAEAKRLKPEN
jgi:hypothetical protein